MFNNARVNVDLSSYSMGVGQMLRLFDAAPGQLADGHTFGELNVTGAPAGQAFHLAYDDDPTGDVFLVRSVPEPGAALLALVGVAALPVLQRRRGA
ncbi:MAG: hypothetical protein IT424_11095 [Pirellulales bacterium]|nr:hypothetical protein [Pirellulales bacterium]